MPIPCEYAKDKKDLETLIQTVIQSRYRNRKKFSMLCKG